MNQMLKDQVLENVYEKDNRQFINFENYCLDFSHPYLFLGFTKSDKIILGDIIQFAYNGVPEKIRKRYAVLNDDKTRFRTDGSRYSLDVQEEN